MKLLSKLFSLLDEGVKENVFPGAVAGVYFKGNQWIVGRGFKALTPFTEPVEEETIYDLASLTKPLALVHTLWYLLNEDPKIDLEKPCRTYADVPEWLGEVPLYRLLNHTSGLKAWHPFYKEFFNKKASLKDLIEVLKTLPPEYTPGTKCVYSDLGYFLFTYILEEVYKSNFENLFEQAKKRVSFSKKAFLSFSPLKKGIDQEDIAPTSVCPWSKVLLRGVVEDENTRAIGGVAGVAGLFGNIKGVLDVLTYLIEAYKKNTVRYPFKKLLEHKEEVSEFTLGFMIVKDEEKPDELKDLNLFKHTGFTGCSFLIDFENEIAIVLLSNRVHPTRENIKIRFFRKRFHLELLSLLYSL